MASRPHLRPRGGPALWLAFALVHGWLTVVGVVLIPNRAFYDVDLYRYWVALGLVDGQWPVLDGPWVYPAGALVPMLVPAAVGAGSTVAYALGWSALVTVLDGVAALALVRHGSASNSTAGSPSDSTADSPSDSTAGSTAADSLAAWWWLAFLALLGPVAMGRIDAIVAPLVVLALLAAMTRPRVAAALLTAGAWIKVAPGALVLPLAMAARRPLRDVVVPAALVCVVVLGAVAAGGGLGNVTSFLLTQDARGLQVESVTATPWVLRSTLRGEAPAVLNRELVTWEAVGPGADAAARVLDVLLPLAVAGLAVLLWRARAHGGQTLVWGSLALMAVLIVVNKVGSPQFVGWLAPPVAVLLATRRPGALPRSARVGAVVVLVLAALTQAVFPWFYPALLDGNPVLGLVLAGRNLGLVGLLALCCIVLVRIARTPAADGAPEAAAAPGLTAAGA
ncbi:glycosyltransferase 87 family protein [Cellulomonas fimi]|uniref:DUF2029 domain-containing protein n=1 Tax=Cellulomonas fimi TaxID=1708 RepID=A0A7Y0LUV9_CELFI|nr:glycosyltransferase 87 family protein [Cellulomonas fimi]NMR18641.1 DUF2029 domain-containing protein [Cellulomonas fimi]